LYVAPIEPLSFVRDEQRYRRKREIGLKKAFCVASQKIIFCKFIILFENVCVLGKNYLRLLVVILIDLFLRVAGLCCGFYVPEKK